MTGATGYIGKHLSNYLTEKGGHRIIPLGRAMFREGMSGLLVQTLTHCDVIINLAGAPINQRWTPEHKQELFNSRITVTHRTYPCLECSQNQTETYDFGLCCRILPLFGGIGRVYTDSWRWFSVRSLLCVGEGSEALSATDQACHYPFRCSAFSRWGSDATDASPATRNKGCRRHRAGYATFSVDRYS